VTNFGAHSNDAAQWALGMDASGPVEIEDQASEWPPKGSLYNTATKTAFRARYANGVELICKTDQPGFGVRFEGTAGWVEYGYSGLKTFPESLKTSKIGPDEIHLPMSNPIAPRKLPAFTSQITCGISSTRSSPAATRSRRWKSGTGALPSATWATLPCS